MLTGGAKAACAALAAATWVLGPSARADGIDYGSRKYQDELMASARAEEGLEPEPNPEGKTIERIVTVPYGVILPDEPYPRFLNWLHVTTLSSTVDRELIFKAGDPWRQEAVDESARNLRNYLFLTSARIIACQGSRPGSVVALVVTKDLWSLRPNSNFTVVGTQLDLLQTQLTEQNVAGRMKRATLDFTLDLATYLLGQQYQDPRIEGSDLSASEHGDLIWNRGTGVMEGGVVTLNLQRPLYTLDTPWGWVANFHYRKDIDRTYADGVIAEYQSPTTGQLVPYVIGRHLLDFQAGATRSLGHAHKSDYSAGYLAFVHQYDVPALAAPVLQATMNDFNGNVVPLSESAGMLYVSYHHYEATFLQLLDIQTFAVTEDFHLGLDFVAEARFADPAFGFSSTFAEPIVGVTWTGYFHDDLYSANLGVDVRYEPDLNPSNPWVDGSVTIALRNASPRFSIFRFHAALQAGRRFNDFNHTMTSLGGDNELRGYPQGYLLGSNFWVSNFELRTQPVPLWTVHVGLASFVDVGAAADSLPALVTNASAGGGLRIGFPQFDRQILRLDLGFPLTEVIGASPSYFVAQYGQAF